MFLNIINAFSMLRFNILPDTSQALPVMVKHKEHSGSRAFTPFLGELLIIIVNSHSLVISAKTLSAQASHYNRKSHSLVISAKKDFCKANLWTRQHVGCEHYHQQDAPGGGAPNEREYG
jgi:hypothetical protein